MSLADQIERVRDSYPPKAGQRFRDQLQRAREGRDHAATQNGQPTAVKGMDRSGVLTPLPRPTIVRSLVDAS